MIDCPIAAPGVRGYAMRERKHLHHCASCKHMHNSTRLGLDFGHGFANVDAGDSFDLAPQGVGRVGEQLAMKLLYLGSPRRRLG
jgi:hypothetical protein